ncbi:17892_t:CDS:1 [Funneliformis caledonium]|uniref:17892_t:CDS:1 n=1 Tax=Funneliformis caledonium TaxID=1117310 RepID=A0A9N9BV25_9GLOM|nr:17892_t:CDS:1 [Funneliformis caledonium]
MVNAQEYIESNFPKNVKIISAISCQLEGHLDLSEYPNLTSVDIGCNSRLTSLQLAQSTGITFISIFETGIDNFSFLAYTPNIHAICLPRPGDIIGDHTGSNVYFSKALRESCQENYKLQTNLKQSNRQIQTQLDQEIKKISDNNQRIKKLEQENQELQSQNKDQQNQINELSNIALPNSPYNLTKLKQEIIRLKVQELAPKVRNESTKVVKLIEEAKNKAGNFSSIVDLILETQKQIVQNSVTSQRDIFFGKMEAYRTILESVLSKEELQTLLNKQTEFLELEKHLKSLQL